MQQLLKSRVLQAKLTINQPGDVFEQEADHVADAVMRMPDPSVSPKSITRPALTVRVQRCSCGKSASVSGECEECKAMRLQRTSTVVFRSTNAPPIVHDVLSSPGQPLDASTRSFMEPRFGTDFSHVRVHTDARAAESAAAVDAVAYAVGSRIVFNTGKYTPTSQSGQRLLAHELTHIVQQGSAPRLSEPSFNELGSSTASAVTVKIMRTAVKLQRISCDVGAAPGMSCTDAQGSGHPTGTNLEHFDQDQHRLEPAHLTAITAFHSSWVARGSKETVEVHGYASCDGQADHNVQLSCDRAETVAAAEALRPR